MRFAFTVYLFYFILYLVYFCTAYVHICRQYYEAVKPRELAHKKDRGQNISIPVQKQVLHVSIHHKNVNFNSIITIQLGMCILINYADNM